MHVWFSTVWIAKKGQPNLISDREGLLGFLRVAERDDTRETERQYQDGYKNND
jgi:hypothetical protein